MPKLRKLCPNQCLRAAFHTTKPPLSRPTILQPHAKSPHAKSTLNQAEWNNFTSFITSSNGSGVLTAADGGTYDLKAKNTPAATGFSRKAGSDSGTTLKGNDSNAQTLTASNFGNDTLVAGNGNNVTLGGGGNGSTDTFVGGTGTGTKFFVAQLAGGTSSFASDGTEHLRFGSALGGSTTTVMQANTSATITGSDGVMTAIHGVGGVEKNTINWTAGGSEVDTFTLLGGGAYTETRQGFSSGNGSGTPSPVQTVLSGAVGTVALSNASIALTGGSTATFTGSGNTITVSGSGDVVTVTGAGNTVIADGSVNATVNGNSVSFTGAGERVVFSDPSTVIVGSGVQTTIQGTDGTLTVDNGADGSVHNVFDATAGGSVLQGFTFGTGTVTEDDRAYAGSDGTGTLLYEQLATTHSDGSITATISSCASSTR